MNEIKSTNIKWHPSHLSKEDRIEKLDQSGAVIWLTGLSGSGKSTIATELESILVHQGRNAYVLDGDNIRHGLNADLGFSPRDREENIRRISEVAKLFYQANIICILAFVSPYRKDRDFARSLITENYFFEIFCDTPLETCRERDPKGLYKKADAGEIKEFTGISAPYEEPIHPELVIKTEEQNPHLSAQLILDLLKQRKIV